MKQKKIIAWLLLSVLLVSGSGCGEKAHVDTGRDNDKIFVIDDSEVDFSIEVSGRLSEEPVDKDNGLPVTDTTASAEGQYSNKVLRWGIARKKNNQTPAADPGAPELLKKFGGAYIGDTSKKVIYLTFDEGYENGYTGKILDALRDNNAKAVFFITGPYLRDHEDLVKRMVDEGHIVGNHTVHHPSLPDKDDRELETELAELNRVFYEKFGQNMKYLRPPKGEYSERTLALTQKLGYTNLFWSFAYDDWYRDKVRGADYAYDIVMRNLHNGAVLLLHAVSKDNADALDRIIKGAREKGYEIGNVEDIVKIDS